MKTFEFLWRDGMASSAARQLTRRVVLYVVGGIVIGLAPAACATAHARGGGSRGAPQAIVQLNNDLDPPSDVTVYAVSAGGFRQLLGDVLPGKKQVLHFPLIGASENMRLIAEPGLGRPVRSQQFVITDKQTVINWDLWSNSMWFQGEGQE